MYSELNDSAVVVAVALGADRRNRGGVGEAFGVADRGVLHATIVVVHDPGWRPP